MTNEEKLKQGYKPYVTFWGKREKNGISLLISFHRKEKTLLKTLELIRDEVDISIGELLDRQEIN